jgi:hypothetical protein
MSNRVVLKETVWMPVSGQPMLVQSGSTVDVNSASMFSPQHIASVTIGGGQPITNGHNKPGPGFSTK